jgi:pimeloyl-ACP methyl ester carboxylesterase
MKEGWTNNGGVRIHWLDLQHESRSTPLLIVPGMTNTAEEVSSLIESHISRRTLVISIRGRGRSDSPASGYSLNDQASDVVAVCHSLNLKNVIIAGHSVGAAIALLSASQINAIGVILMDYPPYYPQVSQDWVEQVLQDHTRSISDIAIRGLARDGEAVSLKNELNAFKDSALFLKGILDTSLVPDSLLIRIQEIAPYINVEKIENAGHELFEENPSRVMSCIDNFVQRLESSQFH